MQFIFFKIKMEVNIVKEYAFLMLYNKYKYYNYYASQSKKISFVKLTLLINIVLKIARKSSSE